MNRRSFLRRALGYLRWIVLVGTFLFAASVLGAIVPGRVSKLAEAPANIEIGLIAGPIHYDLLLPLTADVRARFAFARDAGVLVDQPGDGWLLVGWGAREFYRTVGTYSDVSFLALGKAITGDRSVLRLGALPGFELDTVGAERILISSAGFDAMLAHIQDEMVRDPSGRPVLSMAPGFSAADAFFEAKGHFNFFHPCNMWISETLRAGGQQMGAWTPTTLSVRISLWWFSA